MGWDTAGNTDQEVVSSPSLSHDRAFRYSGSAGGCWEAIAQSPEESAIASEGTTVISGDIRVGSGYHGCHSDTAQIKISTCDDGWSCGKKQRFISFADTGRIEVSGADDDLGSWTQNKWYNFTVTYERSDGQVTYTVEVEDEETTVEKEEGGFENKIAYLWINTGGYTNYVDNLKITHDDSEISGDPGSGSFNIQNGLAINDDVAYVVSDFRDGEIQKIDLEDRTVMNSFDAPSGSRAVGLAYGDGSLWFSDGSDPSFDGEILELDPETGEIRARIDTSYDPTGLAFGESSLWAIDITSNDIDEYTTDGTREGGFDIQGPTGVTYGRGLAYFDESLWVGEFAGSDGSSTASLYEFTTDGELIQETGERTFPDGEGGGYGGLATTSTELLGPDKTGSLTTLRTLADDPADDKEINAVFEITPEEPIINQSVTFDASKSNTSGDTITMYEFDLDDDGDFEIESSDPTLTHTFSSINNDQITLRVTDTEGRTATTTEPLTIHLEDYSSTLETATALDEASTLSLVNANLPEEQTLSGAADRSKITLENLETAVRNNELEEEAAQQAVYRLNTGQEGLLTTVQKVGPADRGGFPKFNLALRMVRKTIDIVIGVIISVESAKLGLDSADGGDILVDIIQGLLQDLLSGVDTVLETLLGSGETKQTVKQECIATGISIGEGIQTGEITTSDEFEEAVDTAVDNIVEIVTAGPRAFVDFSAVAETVAILTNPSGPIDFANIFVPGSTYQLVSTLHEELQPSKITDGLSGTTQASEQALLDYQQSSTRVLVSVVEFMENLSFGASELSVYETVTEFLRDNNEGLLTNILTGIGTIAKLCLSGPVTIVVNAIAASTGFGTLVALKNQQARLIESVLAGGEVSFDAI